MRKPKPQPQPAKKDLASSISESISTPMFFERPLFFERMEPKILLSADALAGVVSSDPFHDDSASHHLDLTESANLLKNTYGSIETVDESLNLDTLSAILSGSQASNDDASLEALGTLLGETDSEATSRQEIIFVDAATPDYEALLEGITSSADTHYQIIILQSDQDGIEQMTRSLGELQGIDAIHLVSHGNELGLQLGDVFLSNDNLSIYNEQLQQWAAALDQDADLLIYGCELAAGEAGQSLINNLAELTGADVAASDDLTGETSLGGDWQLEYTTGDIESGVVISTSAQQTWSNVLATFTVTTNLDVINAVDGLTSLREAIIDANMLAGADEIVLGAGTYTLTLGSAGEDFSGEGDLDIRSDITITGADAATTTIDASGIVGGDRVFNLIGGSLTMTDVTVQGGDVVGGGNAGRGGGFYVDASSTLTLDRVVVQNNAASVDGGGIMNRGTIDLTDVTIANNGNASTDDGGGIYNRGSAILDSVTLSGNQAVTGGAVSNDGADMTLTNVTLSGNTASTDGGAIYNIERLGTPGTITITNSTLTGNTSAGVNGIWQDPTSTLDIKNTILNDGGSNISGGIVTSDYNIDSDGSAGLGGANDVVGNPLLGGLADNGGFTQTHALLSGSVAINAGTSTGAPTTDQRGQIRMGETDAGAFEFTDYGLIWGDIGTDKISVATLDLNHVTDLITGLNDPTSVAIDPDAGKVYWANEGDGKIQRANIDGTGVEDVVTGLVGSISIDLYLAGGKIYWTDGSGSLLRANLDGTAQELISASPTSPTGVAVDGPAGMVYWVDDGSNAIGETSLTGTGTGNLITSSVNNTADLALDLVNDKIYWTNTATGQLWRANLSDGSGIGSLNVGGTPHGIAVDPVGNRSYWTDSANGEIHRAVLSNGTGQTTIISGLVNPYDVDVFSISSVTANNVPVLGTNTLSLSQGDVVVIDSSNLAATDVDNVDSGLIFNVSSVSHGFFAFAADTTTAITSFTQNDVTAGVVRFVHDGGELAPTFDVSVSDGSLASAPAAATINFTGTSDGVLWLSLNGNEGTGSGIPGLNATDIEDDDILQQAGPNFSLGETTTDGSFSIAFDASAFAGDENTNGMHYVTSPVTIGSTNAITLQAGDLILTNLTAGTFVSNGIGAPADLVVDGDDIFFFRPDTAGDYSVGNFYMLISDPFQANEDIEALTLVEKDVFVGDRWLNKGDILLTNSGNDIWLFETATLDPTSGITYPAAQLFIEGDDVGVDIEAKIVGLDVIEQDAVIGGQAYDAGTILIAMDGDDITDGIGSTAQLAEKFDVVALTVNKTTLVAGVGNAQVDATIMFDGDNVNVDGGQETLDGLTLTQDINPGNVAPVLGNNDLVINEGATVTVTSTMLSATDVDSADNGLVFNVSAVTGGQFELTSAPGVAVTSFNQGQVLSSAVVFVDDGDAIAPTFDISITDGTNTTAVVAGGVTFTSTNDAPTISVPSTVFINELHYDNAGIDSGEAVELMGPAGTDLSGWSLVFYSGADNLAYRTEALAGVIADQSDGFGVLVFNLPVDGIENGIADGIALVNASSDVVQFISYEGVLTAADGPAAGLTSTDIGVAEDNLTLVGDSLQLTGTGSEFTWTAASANTFGTLNTGQSVFAVDTGTEDTDKVYNHAEMLTLLGASDTDDADANLSIKITNVINGTITLTGGTGIGDIGTTFTFTPTANFNGQLTFDYQVLDDDLAASAIGNGIINISPVNDDPTLDNAIADQVATEDSPFSFTIPAITFGDVDGDSLTYTATLFGGGALPAWLSFDGTDTFSGTPLNADVGTLSIEVTADDSNGGTITDTFDIVVANTNDDPTLDNAIANQAATEDSAFSFTIPATTFGDVDGDSLTYTATLFGGGALPAWLSFDGTDTFSGTPLNADVGTLSIEVTADDSNGGTITDTFDIVVANTNDDPTLDNAIANQAATEDSAFSFTIPATTFGDVDGDSLTYTATLFGGGALPAWLSFDGTDTFSGTPLNADVGTLSIEVTADDSNGGTITDTFDIVVGSSNDAPTATNLASSTNYIQGTTAVALNDIVVTDVDSGEMVTATLTLANVSTGTLTANDGASYNATTGVWTITGTVAQVNTALANLSFVPAPGNVLNTSVAVSIDDGDEDFSGPLVGALSITVTPLEVTPEVTPPEPTPEVTPPEPTPEAELPPEVIIDDPVIETIIDETVPEAEPVVVVEADLGPSLLDDDEEVEIMSLRNNDNDNEKTSANQQGLASAMVRMREQFAAFSNPLQLIGAESFITKLNDMREELILDDEDTQKVIGGSLTVSAGLSVGYVVWLARSGVLLSSVLSSLPAWSFIDPLPVLGTLRSNEDEDDESLESMVDDKNKSVGEDKKPKL